MSKHSRNLPSILGTAVLIVLAVFLPGCGGGKNTIVQITNKITSLPAGQTYQFTGNVQHDQKMGATASLTGAGTLVIIGETATYKLQDPISLQEENEILVIILGKPGSYVTVQFEVQITPDATTTQTVGIAGGTVSVENHLGDIFTLTVPPRHA